jgi:hypothetical protein
MAKDVQGHWHHLIVHHDGSQYSGAQTVDRLIPGPHNPEPDGSHEPWGPWGHGHGNPDAYPHADPPRPDTNHHGIGHVPTGVESLDYDTTGHWRGSSPHSEPHYKYTEDIGMTTDVPSQEHNNSQYQPVVLDKGYTPPDLGNGYSSTLVDSYSSGESTDSQDGVTINDIGSGLTNDRSSSSVNDDPSFYDPD